MKKLTLLITFLLMLTLALPTFAQDGEATAEPMTGDTEMMQDEMDAQDDAQDVEVTRIRFANLSPTAGILDIFVEGQDIGLQQLMYPSVTGWVEIPADSFTVSFQQDGAMDPVAGPYTITNEGEGWVTLAVAGSVQTDNLTTYKTVQNLAPVPEGCAYVTVFNAINGSPALELRQTDTDVVFSGLGFAGGEAGAMTSANNPAMVYGQCPQPVASTEAVISTTGPVECVALSEDGDNVGGTGATCAYSFFLPANVYDMRFAEVGVEGVSGAYQDIEDQTLNTGNYYFIALIGEQGDSQYFVYELNEDVVESLLRTGPGEGIIGLEEILTPIPTGEAITPEPVG